MNLEKLQINACIRSGWQAVDLGFLMASAWWRPLFVAAALPALILFIPLLIVFADSPAWAGFFIWWLKPFWERLPLYFASRRIFGEGSNLIGILSQVKSTYLKDMLPWLLWRRLSVQRAFDAPVTVLEGLTGSNRSSRLRVLHGKYSDVALGNQLVCFCFEVITGIGVVILLAFFIPEDFGLETHDSIDNLNLVGEWLYTLSAFAAMMLVMPFHSMAGFALYLNRRIELEAWDIEISFRNLANRKKRSTRIALSTMLAMLMLAFFATTTPTGSYAATTTHDQESARQLIEEVFQGDSFGQQKMVSKWRFKNWFDDWKQENEDLVPEWFIEFLEWLELNFDFGSDAAAGETNWNNIATWLKVMLVVFFVASMVYLFNRYRGPLSRLARKDKTRATPEVMFGLDVRPESLPEDVPAQVLQLWQAGHYRDALGLLYRASLSRLIDQHELQFRASHTEAECAALVTACGIDSLSDYFNGLTDAWRRLAYGHLRPQTETVEQLCAAWSKELSDETA